MQSVEVGESFFQIERCCDPAGFNPSCSTIFGRGVLACSRAGPWPQFAVPVPPGIRSKLSNFGGRASLERLNAETLRHAQAPVPDGYLSSILTAVFVDVIGFSR